MMREEEFEEFVNLLRFFFTLHKSFQTSFVPLEEKLFSLRLQRIEMTKEDKIVFLQQTEEDIKWWRKLPYHINFIIGGKNIVISAETYHQIEFFRLVILEEYVAMYKDLLEQILPDFREIFSKDVKTTILNIKSYAKKFSEEDRKIVINLLIWLSNIAYNMKFIEQLFATIVNLFNTILLPEKMKEYYEEVLSMLRAVKMIS